MALTMLDFHLDPDEEFFPECFCPSCFELMDYYPRQVYWMCPDCAVKVTEPREGVYELID